MIIDHSQNILMPLLQLLQLLLLVSMVDEALHLVVGGVAVHDELLQVELVRLVPGDLTKGEEPRYQLRDYQQHHHTSCGYFCNIGK